MYYSAEYDSPLGKITLCSDGSNLIGLWIEGQKYFGGAVREKMVPKEELPIINLAKDWLKRYFAGDHPAISELPLAPNGGGFRQEVWKILCEIPYGKITTYGHIAKKVAARRGMKTMSSQAVGGAVGHNPISIIIPCHRVVGSNGSLTGYAGGIATKIRLLAHECVDMSDLFVPTKGTAL